MAADQTVLTKKDFFTAAKDGDLTRVEEGLREHPEWAREKDADGHVALCVAVYFGNADCAKALLPHSEGDARTPGAANTMLMLAAKNANPECVRILLESGAKTRMANGEEETALMMAAHAGSESIARTLLPLSDPKAKSSSGWTALMWAANGASVDCVKLLIPVSDLEAASVEENATALGLAQRRSAWDCADLLAVAMSERHAKKLRAQTPSGVALPMCEALIERSELERATRGAAEAGSSLAAAQNSRPVRRV